MRRLALIFPLALMLAAPAVAAPTFSALRCDPDCNVRVNATLGPANHVSLAVDPANANNVIAAANDYSMGEQYGCSRTRVWLGLYRSSDAGRSWSGQLLTDTGPHNPQCLVDPVLAYGPGGNAYVAGIALGVGARNEIIVAHSDGAGASWSYAGTPGRDASEVSLAVDPFSGKVWATWVDTGTGSIEVSYSSDRGAIWREVDLGIAVSPVALGHGPQIAIGPSSAAYLTWRDPAGIIWFARSLDAGLTWAAGPAATTLSAADAHARPHGSALVSNPDLAVDLSTSGTRGTIYIAYADVTLARGEVRAIHSHDGGLAWGEPVLVGGQGAAAVLADEFMPQISVDGRGTVHVAYYSAPDPSSALLQARMASGNGDAFDPSITLSSTSFDPSKSHDRNGRPSLGDQIGSVSVGTTAYAAWTDTRAGRADVYFAAVPG